MNKQIIISIGREHGSAGHEIAIRLAEKLNFPVYDKNFFDEISKEKGIIIGTIRMGFGHCRMALALASAAKHLGYNPYWMDLMAFPETPASKTIKSMEGWYNIGSRLSQKNKWFNKHIWEM